MEKTLAQNKLYYTEKHPHSFFYFYGPIIYLFTQVVDGPLRFALQTIGVEILLYSRDIIPIAVVVMAIGHAIAKGRINYLLLIILFILALYGLVGLVHIPNIFQVAFGFKILLPFLMGVLCYAIFFTNIRRVRLFFGIYLMIACIGIYANFFVEFPWQGLNYLVGGIKIEGTLDRETMGFDRLVGFSRANFEAATQILMLSIFMVAFTKNKLVSLIIWLIAGGAIFITTTKAAIGIYLLISLFFLAYKLVRNRFKIYSKMLIIPLCLMIALPLYLSNEYIEIDPTDTVQVGLFASFGDRALNAWPPVFKHVRDNGNTITGLGIGGAGASEQRFADEIHGFTDNMFVFLYAWFGVLSVFFLTIAYLMSQRLDIMGDRLDFCIFVWIAAILWNGITSNMVESPIYGFFIGISLKHIFALSLKNKRGRKVYLNALLKPGALP